MFQIDFHHKQYGFWKSVIISAADQQEAISAALESISSTYKTSISEIYPKEVHESRIEYREP